MKKRIESLLMALCLCLSLLPAGALAEESITASVSKQAVMSATGSPLGYDAKAGKYGSYDQLYFGTYYNTETGDTAGTPHAWRILDGQTNTEEDGLFLLSIPSYEGVRFTLAREDESIENWWLQPHNVWTSPLCSARAWCQTLAESGMVFTDAEQGAIPAVTKSSERYNPTSSSYFTSQHGSVQTGALKDDKVFYLSAKEFEDERYGLTKTDISSGFPLRTGVDGFYTTDDQKIEDGLIASTTNIRGNFMLSTLRIYSKWYTGSTYAQDDLTATEKFFLDSAKSFGFLPKLLLPDAAEDKYEYVYNTLSARPAMNLDGDKLLYLTRADNGGHTAFGKVADASDNWEWKATVRNSSDTAFQSGVTLSNVPTDNVLTGDSRTVTVNHPALNTLTGYNTITAALINASGELVCYGSIRTNEKDGDQSATSTDLTIPDGLVPDGTYTLRVTAEQWNGVKTTDLAAEPFEAQITVANDHYHCICGSTTCWDSSHFKVAWTPVSTAADLMAMTADGYYFLTGDVAAPESAVVGHLCTNGNTVTGTLQAGDGLTLCDCNTTKKPIAAVAVAEDGTYTQYGLTVKSLSSGKNSTLNIRSGASHIYQENSTLQLGEGTKLNIYSGFVYRTGDDVPALPENCEIHMYAGSLYIPVNVTSQGSKLCLYGGKTFRPITLGANGSLIIDPSDSCTITSLCMESGSTVTVPSGATIETVTAMAANTTLTVQDGGTLVAVESAAESSTINLHRCTAYSDKQLISYTGAPGTIDSDGTVNLYGAVYGATFTVTQPLNICADLGTKAGMVCTVDVMNADGTPKVDGGVFTKGWDTYMADAAISDYFKTPTAYMIVKNDDGELLCKKRNHEAGDHPLCGENCTHSGAHTNVTSWTEISDVGTSLSNGSYLLMTDVTRTASGGTITVNGTVNICLNGYTLDLNGGCFEIASGATLNICDCAGTGQLTGGKGEKGGAVYVNGGTFNLYSGELAGNAANSGNECAVYVSGGTFDLCGGSITGSDGVEVAGGQFNMTGGTISVGYNDVAVWMTGGTASMTGGTIDTRNPMNISAGTFTLSPGGSIVSTYNPINVSGGTLQINGGSVVSKGYAVELSGGAVNMTGGKVAGNSTVEIKSGTFNMSGGTIVPNEALGNCWRGVRLAESSTGTFIMSGGTITGFRSSGVEVYGGTMRVSGTAKITGNKLTINQRADYQPPRNVLLASGKTITVGTMSSGAEIGITMAGENNATSTGTFSTGGSSYKSYFSSDDTDYTVESADGNLKLSGDATTPTLNGVYVDGDPCSQETDGDYSITVEVGQSVTLTADVTPADADYTFSFGYSYATVKNNVLTGVSVYRGSRGAVYYKNEQIGSFTVTVIAPASYTVTYDLQGHGTQIDQLTTNANAVMTAPTDPKDENYHFVGWYRDAACTAGNLWNFDTDKVTANITLYAKWTAKGYSMTLNANGGTCPTDADTGKPIDSTLLIYGEACSALPTPTRTGYTFAGWVDCDSKTLTTATVLKKTYPETAAGRTLTAQWTPLPATEPTVAKGDDLTLTYGYTGDRSISVSATAADSDYTLSYQWYTCDASGANASAITGATGSSLTIEAGRNAGTTYYICAVTATRGDNGETAAKNSGIITVTVNRAEPASPTALGGYAGNKLSTVDLPDGWSWVNGETVLSTEQSTYAAKYTDSTGNYHDVASRDLTVAVTAKEEKGLTVDMEGWTYGETASEPQYTKPTDATNLKVEYKGKTEADSAYTSIRPTDVGDYTVTVSFETASAVYTGSADFAITRANLTAVSVAQTGTLTYNGSAQTATVTAEATAANGQTVHFTYSMTEVGPYTSAVPSFTAANETGYTVYYKANAANHNEATGSFTVTLAKRTPTAADFTFTAPTSLIYNGESKTAALTGTISGLGDITVKYNGKTAAPTDAGTYTVTIDAEANDNCNAATNLTAEGWTFTIDKADPIAPTGLTGNRGNRLSSVSLAAFPNWLWEEPDTVMDSVGQQTFSAKYEGSTNYNEKSGVMLTVNVSDKAQKTLAVNMTGWTYGKYSATANTPSYTMPDGATDLTVEYKAKGADDNTYSSTVPANAGEYTVRVSYETATDIYTGTADFTITKAALTVTARPKTITYGDAPANGGVEYSGFMNGEGESVLTGTLTYDYSYTQYGAVGSNYTITPSGLTSNNYDISFAPGTLTVTPKTVGLDWAHTDDLIYTGQPQAPTATATGLVNGDSCTVTVTDAQANAGTNYTATATGLSNANYQLPEANTATFSIAKAELPESSYPTGLTGYAGNKLSSVSLSSFPGWSWVDGSAALSTGQSTYAASYAGDDNHNGKANVALTVAVAEKAGRELTITLDGWTYGDAANTPSYAPAAPDGISVTVEYKVKDADDSTYVPTAPTDAGEYTVRVSYETATEIWAALHDFTIAKATPTGAPKYTAITTSGKTLADAALTTEGSTFSVEGTVQWVDADGKALAATTTVAANTAYTWLFTPTSGNYTTLSGEITLWNYTPPASSGSATVTVPVSSDSASVNVKAEVSQGNAKVEVSDAQIDQVASDGAGAVTVDVSSLQNVTSATVPSHVVEKTNEAEDTALTVALPTGSVSLDETALESVTETAKGKDVTVSVVAIPTASVAPVVKDIIGMEPSVVAVVDVNITVNGIKKSSFDGGKVTISIPYTPKKGEDTSKLTVWFIKDDGTIENKGGWYDAKNKCFVFETEHLSQYVLLNAPTAFTDVSVEKYFYPAVNWAVANSITGGTTATTFSPYASCTRGQLVTFLWRAAGKPEAKSSENPFSDVKETSAFYKAILWAAENGIVTGYSDGTFKPSAAVSRQQTAAILYRYAKFAGMDVTIGEDTNILSYSDAASVSAYAVEPFRWATAEGVVTGNKGKLLPHNTCTRAQIVTMLYRLLAK